MHEDDHALTLGHLRFLILAADELGFKDDATVIIAGMPATTIAVQQD